MAARREGTGPVLTVGQLVALEQLHCRIVAGETGSDRPVRWAHSCELGDPTTWLTGGELLMTTGIGLPSEPAAQVEYLERLAGKAVAGIAFGDRAELGDLQVPEISSAFYAAADRLSVPVVVVSGGTPFIAIAQQVAAANRDVVHGRMTRHLRVYQTLGEVARGHLDVATCMRQLSEISGYELAVLSPAGKAVAGMGTSRPDVELSDIEDALRVEDFNVRVPQPLASSDAGGTRTFMVPIIVGRRPFGVLVARAGEQGDDDRMILHHLATIICLFAADSLRERERERREGAEHLARVLLESEREGSRTIGEIFPDQAAERLVLVVAAVGGADTGWHDVHNALAEDGVSHRLVRRADQGMIAVVLGDSDVAALTETLTRALPHATMGISSVVGPGEDIVIPRREARWALRCAVSEGQRLACFSETTGPAWLVRDTSGLEMMVEEILGPLIEHDSRTNGSLEHTLRVFCECNRSWKVASERLFIHRQTLIHRMKRVEQLTGRRVDQTDEFCDLWLATKARRSLAAAGIVDD